MFSSSSGNSEYIGSAKGGIIIDVGVSAKRENEALSALGVDISSIGAVFITHEHCDHIRGLRVFAGMHGLKVYASEGTLAELEKAGVLTDKFEADVVPSEGIEINGMFIKPFHTSHDARESVGYSVTTADGKRISVATDTGTVTEEMFSSIYGSDLIMIESNHDVGMLRNGNYPYLTKRRILSDVGHLSNDACAETVKRLMEGGTKRYFLGHLSKENNVPVLAYETTRSCLTEVGAEEGCDYILKVAPSCDIPKMTVL